MGEGTGIKGTFLKLTGPKVEGNCTKGSYKKQIELMSFSFGVANMASAVDLTKEKTDGGRECTISDIGFSKKLDNASSQLNAHCAVGTLFDKAEITCVDGTPIYTIILEPLVISSVSTSGGEGGEVWETISLNAAKTTWKFQKDSEDWWDASEGGTSIK